MHDRPADPMSGSPAAAAPARAGAPRLRLVAGGRAPRLEPMRPLEAHELRRVTGGAASNPATRPATGRR